MPIVRDVEKHHLLLDTHVWIWLLFEEPRFSLSFLRNAMRAYSQARNLISSISVWEIGLLVSKKKISLKMDCLHWAENALSNTNLVPLSPKIAIESTRLHGDIHRDPADRVLLATAHTENALLITCDKKLLSYGEHSTSIFVHDPSVDYSVAFSNVNGGF